MNPAILFGQIKRRGTGSADKALLTTHEVFDEAEKAEPLVAIRPHSANRRGCKKQTVSHEQYDYE